MKIFLALCFVAAVAQAYDIDWDTVITPEVLPDGLLDQIAESGLTPDAVPEDVSRITNGKEALPGQFPYQVAVLGRAGDSAGFCGGSILNREWILTAAHCVDFATSADVVFAAHNIKDSNEEGQFTVTASTIRIHAMYNPRTISNDVALLKLDTPIEYSDRVQPTRLPRRAHVNTDLARVLGTVSGWGRDSDDATTISPVLRYTHNNMISNAVCNRYFFGMISDNQVCLSGRGGRSSCNGDSGGPLVVTDTDGRETQVGVVSFGIALGCSVGWPGVYARISHHLDWIEGETGATDIVRD